jgi:hypothetical protein
LLWLARGRLFAEPAVSAIALSAVGQVEVRTRHPFSLRRGAPSVARLDIKVGRRTLRFAVFDDVDASRKFVSALEQAGVAK